MVFMSSISPYGPAEERIDKSRRRVRRRPMESPSWRRNGFIWPGKGKIGSGGFLFFVPEWYLVREKTEMLLG